MSKYFTKDGHFRDIQTHDLPEAYESESLNTKNWLAEAAKKRKKQEKEIKQQQQIAEKKRRKAAEEGRKWGLRKMMKNEPLEIGPDRGDLTPKQSRAAKKTGVMSWFGFGGKRRTKKRRKKRRTKSRRKTKRRRKSRRRTKRRRRKR